MASYGRDVAAGAGLGLAAVTLALLLEGSRHSIAVPLLAGWL